MSSTYRTITEIGNSSSRIISRHAFCRGFRSTSRTLAAQNFSMPAMSPTMTEGNITNWKVKEGDSYTAGDVLLEIETDKAQMDVEAQDDGKVAKIMQQTGSKGVRVGSRIAVIAESDDDLSTLTLPAESAPTSSFQQAQDSKTETSHSSDSKGDSASSSKTQDSPQQKSSSTTSTSHESGKPSKQRYPLYPSIAQLLHEKGIPLTEASKMTASGPKGRLLKGDVLAYLGRISSTYSSDQSARIAKLGKLDLKGVKAAPPKEMVTPPSTKSQAPPAHDAQPVDVDIAIPISLSSVFSVQKRIQATLGVTLPLSTFVARASELANDGLPRSAAQKPTADELFDDVLGLYKTTAVTVRGRYVPHVTPPPARSGNNKHLPQVEDVYDLLTSNGALSRRQSSGLASPDRVGDANVSDTDRLLRVNASKGDEKSARVYLERMKTILQMEPGRLIL